MCAIVPIDLRSALSPAAGVEVLPGSDQDRSSVDRSGCRPS